MPKKTNKKLSEILLGKYNKTDWAEYAESNLKPKYYINRYDDKKGNRFYYFTINGEVVVAAGSTTVFGKVSTERERIDEWKEDHPNWRHLLDVSSEYGTLGHALKGDIMFNKGVDKAKLDAMQKLILDNEGSFNTPAKDVLSFIKFQEDFQLKPLLIEASLVWQDPDTKEWLAQTIDLLARMTVTITTKTTETDGFYLRGPRKGQEKIKEVKTEEKIDKILLIDFKGNFFEKSKKGFFEVHKLQLMAAKLAVEQNFDIKVDDCYNFSENNWLTSPSYTFYKWELTQKDWDIWYTYWRLAQLKDINKPQGKIMITDGFKNSSDYKFLSYIEYVKQILMNDKK